MTKSQRLTLITAYIDESNMYLFENGLTDYYLIEIFHAYMNLDSRFASQYLDYIISNLEAGSFNDCILNAKSWLESQVKYINSCLSEWESNIDIGGNYEA